MNRLNFHHAGTCAALLCVALIVPQGCGGPPAAREQPPISWNSPRMRAIQKEWHSLWDAYDKWSPDLDPSTGRVRGENGMTKYSDLQRAIPELLRSRLSDENVRELAATCGEVPLSATLEGFTHDVLAFMVTALAESGDRDRLVRLLSTRCPSRINFPVDIEYYLAGQERTLKDPVKVLAEAYAISKVPETRHALAAAIKRGFVASGVRGKDDADFVDKAMRYYEKEKPRLVVNWRYTLNETASPFKVEAYESDPELYDNPKGLTRYALFVRRE